MFTPLHCLQIEANVMNPQLRLECVIVSATTPRQYRLWITIAQILLHSSCYWRCKRRSNGVPSRDIGLSGKLLVVAV